MAIVKTDVPMTSRLSHETVEALARRYPTIETRELTRTAFGRPVDLMVMGGGQRKIIISAAHHANEWITAPVVLKFAEELAQALEDGGRIFGVPAQTLVKAATIYLVPMVDPDGVDLVTGAIEPGSYEYQRAAALAARYPAIPFPDGWKANLNGVDLNLQYPAGWLRAREIKFSQGFTRPGPRDYVGRAPLTEAEARALAALTLKTEPDMVLALHSQGEVIYWQFGSIQVPGARRYGEEFARLSGYELADTPLNPASPGTRTGSSRPSAVRATPSRWVWGKIPCPWTSSIKFTKTPWASWSLPPQGCRTDKRKRTAPMGWCGLREWDEGFDLHFCPLGKNSGADPFEPESGNTPPACCI